MPSLLWRIRLGGLWGRALLEYSSPPEFQLCLDCRQTFPRSPGQTRAIFGRRFPVVVQGLVEERVLWQQTKQSSGNAPYHRFRIRTRVKYPVGTIESSVAGDWKWLGHGRGVCYLICKDENTRVAGGQRRVSKDMKIWSWLGSVQCWNGAEWIFCFSIHFQDYAASDQLSQIPRVSVNAVGHYLSLV